ncbi:hypothetical protein ACTSEZ_18150 [Metabacillus sp. JX24]|uniref:hypothetical protein n=1 Tax=Metabacillus sp. JX24 TaxID=3240759 RepID=UPI00350F3DD9
MKKLIIVELRKLMCRKEFYFSIVTLVSLGLFIVYQLHSNGSIIQLSQEGNDTVMVGELLIGIIGLFNMTGITAVMVCILLWKMIGSEIDQKIISIYYLNSPSRLRVYFSKLIVSIMTILIYIMLFISFVVITSYLLLPESIPPLKNSIFWKEVLIAGASFVALSSILILFAFCLAYLFGGMGVIVGTIGISIISGILNSYGFFSEWLPLTVTDFYNNYQNRDIAIFMGYILLLIIVSIPLIRRQEVK